MLGQLLWDQVVTAYWCSSDAGSYLRSCCLPGHGPMLQPQQPLIQRSSMCSTATHHQSLLPGGPQTAGLLTVMHLQPQVTLFWAPITWLWLAASWLLCTCRADGRCAAACYRTSYQPAAELPAAASIAHSAWPPFMLTGRGNRASCYLLPAHRLQLINMLHEGSFPASGDDPCRLPPAALPAAHAAQ